MIIGLDPGIKHFAWAIYSQALLETGVLSLPETIAEIPQFIDEQVRAILVKGTIENIRPVIVAERYMFRGISSVHAEKVNLALGALQLLAFKDDYDLHLITAAQWKTCLTKHIRKENPDCPNSRCCSWWYFKKPNTDEWLETEHEADASALCWYFANYWKSQHESA